jgi:hypothetical protein
MYCWCSSWKLGESNAVSEQRFQNCYGSQGGPGGTAGEMVKGTSSFYGQGE